jgi:hypothetical protein
MSKQVVVISGCDAKFYPFMLQALNSLVALNIDSRADIAVLDLGLAPEQVAELQARGFAVKQPYWTLDVPEKFRGKHQIGLVARTALREYFPGYQVYLWFDADAWAQTPEFFDSLVNAAKATGAGVIRENGPNYKRDFSYSKWWFGNMMAAYGTFQGFRIALKPAINIGILCLSDTAPHWEAWINYYKMFIERRERVNNQHSFNAALDLDKLSYIEVPARCNWITTLSTPGWDPATRMVIEPKTGGQPLSVLHLAGPDKERIYALRQPDGGVMHTSLTAVAISALKEKIS